ncbi:hypothetical protein GCM10008090_12290 [Arenicella chitinivorans]|uniref:Mechanosensitive ion channel n=2 Tax=Arenicella chitinivorans TaxID=1329800 RepID=A0A918RMY0_9GAMM|nr:hypothetical protein GCM10008090_12290 [Arenicella chitinivorans]
MVAMSANGYTQTIEAETAEGNDDVVTDELEIQVERSAEEIAAEQEHQYLLSTGERLAELEQLIRDETKSLGQLLTTAKRNDWTPELEAAVAEQRRRIADLKNSFEQLAIGGVNLSLFSLVEEPKDWQEELTLVLKPLLENLRGLTEKPRKIENVRRAIEEQRITISTAEDALRSLDKFDGEKHSKRVASELSLVRDKWEKLKAEATRSKELAELELQNLVREQSSWYQAFAEGFKSFARQRGLTLLIAFGFVVLIVLVFRVLGNIFSSRSRNDPKRARRTTYRILAYTQRLLMFVLIFASVMVVFFVRGDVLLLALMSVLLFALAIGLKNMLPQFLEESRILLNIGRVREQERVLIKGVPWRVATINFYSKLTNPEIRGTLRLPLSDLKSLTSQPLGDHRWFPSSIGDWVLDDANRLYEVTHQGPVTVELQSAQLTSKLIPTEVYFAAGFVNVSKSKRIRLVSVFGIDYAHQSIALDVVPDKFQAGVLAHLEQANIGTNQIEVKVEFQAAGASSLDYRIIVFVGVAAAKHYYRIGRYIQQACLRVCNEEGWGIPFPQLTVHQGTDISVE